MTDLYLEMRFLKVVDQSSKLLDRLGELWTGRRRCEIGRQPDGIGRNDCLPTSSNE